MGAGVPSGRVVAVRARLSDEEVSVGSGVLVSDRLVLTAAHVIAEPGGRVLGPLEVRLSGSARWWPATVSWADLSDAMDVAVLRVGAEGDGWEPPALPPVRFSRLTGLAGQVDCEAQGFPRSLKDGEERVRDHATGPVNPGVDEQGRRYDVLIREFPAEPPPRSGQSSPWSGMSGAGLFADGLLLGILTLRTGGFGERRLRATPLRVLAADAAFRDALTGGRPLALESVELHRLFTETIDDWGDSPALLLHPLRAVVGFYGRHDERRALTSWCVPSTEPATRVPGTTAKVQALTGPGGQGKTRLAEQVCADLAAAGWVAGFLAADATTDQITILADTNTPVLIVVDYADTRHDQTHALLRILRQRTAAPVRALLLARSASRDSGWWAQLRSQFPDLCATVEPRPLPPLQPDGTRADAFHHAAIDLATVWARTDSTADWPTIARRLPAPRDLDANRYALALTLQMAALTALLQAGPRPVEASAGDDVADVLLGHEQRYWTASATARGLAPRFPDVLLRWAVVTAALCGAADRAEAVDTVGRLADLREEPPASRLTLAEWLHHLYPAADDRYWGALQPDRIAEHLVSHTLTAGSDPYPQLATDVLATARPRQLTQALIVLARAAAHQNGVPALLAGLLTQPPISSAVTQLPLHDLTAILDAFPNFSLRLTDTAATLTGLTIDQLRRNTDQPPDLARQLNNQSVRLADL
ncbi:conserved hypothetical protein [Frankia canadensis]|uniref:Novel STAND NTPase 5 domain-containing protein n=1 Tax=Frankia canadensis TaxID=1836972 RepID=A0A2I2KV10_9ACTN|nr:serine protease [Frankia canadensis]SNQ49491.1 conserved hypothetical protein [Frankia canadensis]SOU56781.1 conserved hypothetical protein [Frankia canadensis]